MFDPCPQATDKDLIDQIAAAERQIAVTHASQALLIAELARRRLSQWQRDLAEAEARGADRGVLQGIVAACDDGTDEVGLTLSLSPGAARRRVSASIALVTRLPRTLSALATGALDWSRAQLFADLTAEVATERCPEVEARVLPVLDQEGVVLTRPKLAHRIRTAVAEVDPGALASRAEQKTAERRVWVEPLPDAMARLCVEGPAAQVRTLYEAIDAAARRETQNPMAAPSEPPGSALVDEAPKASDTTGDPAAPDDADRPQDSSTGSLASVFADRAARREAAESDPTRPVDTRRQGAKRFDALVAMASDVLADPVRLLGTLQGQRPHIQVTIAASTLAGEDDRAGELSGYGPIPAQVARRIAALGEWRRLVTDPVTGALLEYGRTTYRPPAALRDFILARDATCIQPTCHQPSRRAQIDHLIPHADGGATSPGNTGPECRRHHAVKTHRRRWSVERLPDGSVAWTTPTGHVRIRPPDPIGPVPAVALTPQPARLAERGPEVTGAAYEPTGPDDVLGDPEDVLSDQQYAEIQLALDEAQRATSTGLALHLRRGGDTVLSSGELPHE